MVSFVMLVLVFVLYLCTAIMIVEKCKPTKTGSNGKLFGRLAYTRQSQNINVKVNGKRFAKGSRPYNGKSEPQHKRGTDK